MPLRKITEDSPAAVLAELDARVRALMARDRELLAEQIKLESVGGRSGAPNAGNAPPKIDVASYLERGDLVVIPNIDRISEIGRERAAIAAAVTLAQQRAFRARVLAEAELSSDVHDRWRVNIRESVRLVRNLRDLADERARLREEYAARVGLPFHATGGVAADRVVGRFTHADAAQSFLDCADKFLKGEKL